MVDYFYFLWAKMEVILLIHFLPLSQRQFMNKFLERLFFATSNKVIWPKRKFNWMHVLKSAILAIFQKVADWLDWPCPKKMTKMVVSASSANQV
jgi:hypothetical protein